MSLEKTSNLIKDLLERAIKGILTLENLHDLWSEKFDGDRVLELVFDDLEDATEHYPYKILSNKFDEKLWLESYEYKKLQADLNSIFEIDNYEKFKQSRKKYLENDKILK